MEDKEEEVVEGTGPGNSDSANNSDAMTLSGNELIVLSMKSINREGEKAVNYPCH